MKATDFFKNFTILFVTVIFMTVIASCSDDDDTVASDDVQTVVPDDDDGDDDGSGQTDDGVDSDVDVKDDYDYSNDVKRPVDLGLSVMWASCNIGASRPEEYGAFFAWGETMTKSDYSDGTSVNFGVELEDFAGNPEYDAAAAIWGDGWRMPTADEIDELILGCDWLWMQSEGIYGYAVTGTTGSYIFLPAGGRKSGLDWSYIDTHGRYWTSTPTEGDLENAHNLHFEENDKAIENNSYLRGRGFPIRPVIEDY